MIRITENIKFKHILSLAIPVMFGMLVQNAVLIIDNIFLAQIGELDFNAGGNGGLFYFTLFMLGTGYSSGLQIGIAKKVGENKLSEIGSLFFQGLYFLTSLGVLLYLIIFFFSRGFIICIFNSNDIAHATYEFMKIRSIGLIFSFSYLAFIGFYLGTGKTKIIFFTSSLIAILNLLLDYGLIFGNLGMPKLGLKGAAIASVMAEVVGFLFIVALFSIGINKIQFGLKTSYHFCKKTSFAILKLGFPLMIQGFLSLGAWSVFFIIVEKTGSFQLSISHIIRNTYSFAIIPIFGFNASIKTIISNLIGQGKIHLIWKPIKKVIILSLSFSLLFVHGNIFYPEKIIKIYTLDPSKIIIGSQLLNLVTGALLIFSISSIAFNAISGTGKTKKSLIIELIAIFLYLTYAFFGSRVKTNQIFAIWSSEYLYFTSLGILSFLFLKETIRPHKIRKPNLNQSNIWKQKIIN